MNENTDNLDRLAAEFKEYFKNLRLAEKQNQIEEKEAIVLKQIRELLRGSDEEELKEQNL